MTLSFYIVTSKKQKKFNSAADLDNFVRNNKFSENAMIVMKNEKNEIIGQMSVKNYLSYEN